MEEAAADVLVVGAGPAGLFAARVAAERVRRVVLLEKNQRPGLKVLISGGGRCNLTTTRVGADLEAQYGTRRGRFLRHALRAFPPQALIDWFTGEGVALHVEDLEKVFPDSQRAGDVLAALVRSATRAGVVLRTSCPMLQVTRNAGGFAVTTPTGVITTPRLVLCSGGLSYPKTGATGDGYAVCAAMGHTIVKPVPALAPLALNVAWVHALQGLVLDAAILTLRGPQGEVLVRRQRPTLFTHKGLSGPAPMDVSGSVEEVGGGCVLEIDLAPDVSDDDLDAALRAAAVRDGRAHAASALPPHLQERLRRALVQQAAADGPLSSLSRQARRRLVACVKRLTLPVDRSLGFSHAEVTRGGVALDAIDARTMQSKLVPGLFVCGELLDVDGPIGGFNFQAAFATARLAGLAV